MIFIIEFAPFLLLVSIVVIIALQLMIMIEVFVDFVAGATPRP
jgi:hypothetical protein